MGGLNSVIFDTVPFTSPSRPPSAFLPNPSAVGNAGSWVSAVVAKKKNSVIEKSKELNFRWTYERSIGTHFREKMHSGYGWNLPLRALRNVCGGLGRGNSQWDLRMMNCTGIIMNPSTT
jgi:hypothetical protein